jgi:hypothetical protein
MSNRNRKRDLQRKLQERELHGECVLSDLPQISYEQLLESGMQHWNEDRRQPHQDHVSWETDIQTLERLAVNYARHWLCPGYDASYRRPEKNLSHRERKEVAVKMALRQIALHWPQLQDECLRQERERI